MRKLETKSPRIFDYGDYRAYLKEYYAWAHETNGKFSHRFIAAQVGSTSSGWFTDVLKARQNLNGTQVVKLVQLLKLGIKESDYFEHLVQFNQSASLDEKNRCFRKLMALKGPQANMVGQNRFEYYSKWYYGAIRELLFFYDFRDDFQALAKKLNPSIKPAEAQEAIRLLVKLDFIRKDAQGRYRPAEESLKKDPTFKSLFAVNFLKASMELGSAALEKFPKEERHISALTLSYSKEGLAKAVVEIEELRNRLLGLMDEDPNPEKVFQMNIQLFPLTQ